MAQASVENQTPDQKMAVLFSRIRQNIISGHLEPGSRLPSVRKLGKQYGVAHGTVAGAMTKLAHEGLVTRARGLGTFVSDDPPVRHEVLDLVRLRAPAGSEDRANQLTWVEELSHASELQGWTPRWHHLPNAESQEVKRFVRQLRQSNGVIIYNKVPLELPWLLHQQGTPVVTVRLMAAGIAEKAEVYPQISFDRRESARLATEHLVSLGYTLLGFVGSAAFGPRIEGFLDVVRQHDLVVRGRWVLPFQTSLYDTEELRIRTREVLKSDIRPEAFCCVSKYAASAVWAAANDLGLKVPEDVAIVACDLGDDDTLGRVQFTAAAASVEETCHKAMEVLEQIRQHPKQDGQALWEPIMMPLHLMVRDSCGAKLRGADTKEIGD